MNILYYLIQKTNDSHMNKPKAIIVSGYFNPLHKGHLELFEKAKEAGDQLFGLLLIAIFKENKREVKGLWTRMSA